MHSERASQQQQQPHGAKFVQPSSRHEIKQRIQEKQNRLRDATRRARLSDVRQSEGDVPCSLAADGLSSSPILHAPAANFPMSCHNEEDEVAQHLGVDDWSAIAQEFGCNLADPQVMDWLLALEEEIRQEALFAFFDAAHTTEEQWDDYYRSLEGH